MGMRFRTCESSHQGAYRYPNRSLPGPFRELPATPREWGGLEPGAGKIPPRAAAVTATTPGGLVCGWVKAGGE